MSPTTSMLQAERTALVVIDLQKKLLPAIFERERVLKNTILLLRLARLLDLPVVLTTQYREGLGDTDAEVLAAMPDPDPIDKLTFGCFGCEDFLARMKRLPGREQLVVAGIESHICVAQTVLGARQAGYEVHLAADATSSRTERNWQVGLHRMERAGAVPSSTEMVIYELLGRSDSSAFRKMLPHLKG